MEDDEAERNADADANATASRKGTSHAGPARQVVVSARIGGGRLCRWLEKLDGKVERKSLAGYFPEEFLLVDPPCSEVR